MQYSFYKLFYSSILRLQINIRNVIFCNCVMVKVSMTLDISAIPGFPWESLCCTNETKPNTLIFLPLLIYLYKIYFNHSKFFETVMHTFFTFPR